MSTATGPNTVPIPRQAWKTAILGGMASYLDSATIVAAGTAFVLYQASMNLGAWDIGALSAILTLSLAFGALIGGRLGDRFGRKRVFSIDLLVFAAGLAFLAFAPSATFLYIGALIAGFAMGADIPVSLALIAEEAPPAHRGKLVAFSQVLWLAGIVASIAISFEVSSLGVLGARILFGHVLVVAIVVWVLRRRLPESSRWNTAVEESDHVGHGAPHSHKGRLRDLLPYLAPVLATALFYTFNNLSANTMGQFSTYLMVNVAGVSVTAATGVALLGIPIGFAGNLVFMKIADRPSRMTGFVVGSVVLVVGFTIPLIFGFTFATLFIASLFSRFGGGLAGEAIYKVWSQELFPTLVRSSAQGSTIFITRALTAGFAFVTPAIAQANVSALLAILVGLNAAAGLVGYFWVAKLPKVSQQEDAQGPVLIHH